MTKKYKVAIAVTKRYVVDVRAKSEVNAELLARKKFEKIQEQGTEHYCEDRDPETVIDMVYDVTNTDDPFNP